MTKGEKIRLYRTKKQITQKTLAELAGVSEVAIKKYESGERNPKPEQIKKIAKALQVDDYDLLDIDLDHLSISSVEDVLSLISLLEKKVGIIFEYSSNSFEGIEPSSITLKFTNDQINKALKDWLITKPTQSKETFYSTYTVQSSEYNVVHDHDKKMEYNVHTKKNKKPTNSDK